jgi:hypothetical protein
MPFRRELNLNRVIGIFFISLLVHPAFALADASGSICVAPLPQPVNGLRGAGPETVVCDLDKYALKVDQQKAVPWPLKESVKIAGLDMAARHRLVILCGGKPRQSFTFRFSDFQGPKLCLFLNDLYWTVQLWQDKRTPWCKCK